MNTQTEPGYPFVKTYRGGKVIDFKDIGARILAQLSYIISDIVPGGELVGREYRAASILGGKGKSFSINIETGVWKDFATNESGGDVINLYSQIKSCSQSDAAKTLSEMYLGDTPKITVSYPVPKVKQAVSLIKPPPEVAPPDFGKDVEAVYSYQDTEGNPWFYIVRRSGKVFHPYCFSTDLKWVAKHWPSPRPLFGLELLTSKKPILLVEGEKAAMAARKLTDKYIAMTWPGGAQAFKQADFSPIYGRRILLWPDADNPGTEAMNGVYSVLREHCPEIKIIQTDQEDGWDAADAVNEGWDQDRFIKWAKPLAKLLDKPSIIPTPKIVDHTISSLTGTFPHQNKALKPLSTIENFKYLMEMYGVVIRYNVITKDEEILIPGKSFLIDNRANASMSWIISTMAKHGMATTGSNDFISYMLGENLYNPVTEWITSSPWDGTSRLQDLYDTVKTSTESRHLKETFIKRWLISAVAAAFNPNGVSAHGVLVFQGDQNIGKTSWLKSLVPHDFRLIHDGVILRPDDKDSVKHAVSFWLVELGELDATFRKSDIAQLKAFLTKDKDILRRAYARRDSEYARRTVFFSSVNPVNFLQDPTGNRRFWTIECKEINFKHCINMQQLWAEVYENLYQKGESWFLTKEEIEALNIHNEDFMELDTVTEKIIEELDWDASPNQFTWLTATHTLERLRIKNINKGVCSKAAATIFKKNGGERKIVRGVKKFLVPPIKTIYDKPEGY